jgi:hypothetical protein
MNAATLGRTQYGGSILRQSVQTRHATMSSGTVAGRASCSLPRASLVPNFLLSALIHGRRICAIHA